MAHLFKPQKVYYLDAEGKRVKPDAPGARKVKEELRKWYAKGPPREPVRSAEESARAPGGSSAPRPRDAAPRRPRKEGSPPRAFGLPSHHSVRLP
jgi:hypothetical protein